MEFKSFMEALKDKQKKLDKNHNGELDSQDFKILRKEEADLFEAGPHDPDFVEKSARHERLYNYHKKMGNDTEAAKHKAEIDKLYKKEETEELDEIHRMKTKLNTLDDISNKSVARQKLSTLMNSGKARGALIANKMRTLNMGDDLDQEDLDALYEVLSKDAKAGDYISDFVHSTNPKFDGKSKKERINMALGAYYNTNKQKDGMSEGNGYDDNRRGFGKPPREDDEYHVPDPEMNEEVDLEEGTFKYHMNKAIASDAKGDAKKTAYHLSNATTAKYAMKVADYSGNKKLMDTHRKMIMKEEAEELDEKSDQAKQNAMMRKTRDASRGARFKLNNPVPDAEPEHKTAQAHNKAIGRALRKYTWHALREAQMTTTKDKSGKLVSFKYEGDWKKSTENKQGSGKAANLAGQAMQKMKHANVQAPVAPVPDRKYIKGTPENKVLKAARKPINGMPTNKIKEEKDEQEYGYEGDMALNQLATLTRCADMIKEILKPDTDLPEWVQSKITLATDYIQTAADYMHSEMNEAKSVEVKVNAAGDASHEENWEAVKKIKKPVKESFDDEGNLIANKVSYKEFMLEYTPGPGGVTQIKGRSYGASYTDPEGADDYDDKKPMKPAAAAAEKRGRGRPAGAKSGARKITGTSNLMNK